MNQRRSATAAPSSHESPSPVGPVRQGCGPEEWTADLSIDQTDPFFFDHPLDHVPGMLMVCGMVNFARTCGHTLPEGRVKAAMSFRAMCELDPLPVLLLESTESGRRNVRVTQDSLTVADGWFEFATVDNVLPWEGQADGNGQAAAEASLVHRARSENIMLGDPWRVDDEVTAPVLPPRRGHSLSGPRPDVHSVESLVEAGRQFSTWLPHRFGAWPLDAQMLWVGVTVDLPMALPRSLPVALRWQVASTPRDKAKFHFDLIAADGHGPVLGSLLYASKALGPDEYTRFRENRGAA
jgi:hypothetical protein